MKKLWLFIKSIFSKTEEGEKLEPSGAKLIVFEEDISLDIKELEWSYFEKSNPRVGDLCYPGEVRFVVYIPEMEEVPLVHSPIQRLHFVTLNTAFIGAGFCILFEPLGVVEDTVKAALTLKFSGEVKEVNFVELLREQNKELAS